MSSLLSVEDLRAAVTFREIYRRYARMGDTLVHVAERVSYATVKAG